MPQPNETAPPHDPNTPPPPESSTPSELPPGQTSPNPEPAEQGSKTGLRGAGLKYAADDAAIPDWARGKTADEILKAAESYRAALLTAPVAPPTPQKTATETMTTPQNGAPQPPDPNLMYTDAPRYHAEMLAYNQFMHQQQMQQFAAPMLQQQADFAKDMAKRSAKVPLAWERYEAEIDAQMANVPLQARTKEAWEMAAKIVAADHMDEIAQARAETLAARTDTGTIGGDGSAPAGGRVASDPLTQLFIDDSPAVARFKAIGKNADDAKKAAAQMGLTPEAYAQMLTQSSVVIHATSGTPQTSLEAQQSAAVGA